MKDAGMRIRLEPELRDAFMSACHQKDVPAAQVLREFMKDFVKHVDTAQSPKKQQKKSKAQG